LLGGNFPALPSGEIRLVQKHYAQWYGDPGTQGDTFVINVIDLLDDPSMDLATSIVSFSDLGETTSFMATSSIGTVSTSIATTLSMVPPS